MTPTVSIIVCFLFSLHLSTIDAFRQAHAIRQAHNRIIRMGIVMAPPPPSPLPESIVPNRTVPEIPQSPTLTYTRASKNKAFAGRDDRPSTDASARNEETTMNHIRRYNAVVAQIQQWNQLSSRIGATGCDIRNEASDNHAFSDGRSKRVQMKMNHPELTHVLSPSGTISGGGNLLAGDLMSEWTNIQ